MNKPIGKTALLYWKSLASADGTTHQLNRLLAHATQPLIHFWWEDHGGPAPDPAAIHAIHLPETRFWRWQGGGRWLRALHRLLPLPVLAPRRFHGRREVRQAFISTAKPPVQTAYVVVYNDPQSASALDLLSALGDPPYVVHLMDLLDETPLTPKKHGHLIRLCARARAVVCISNRLAREIGRFTPAPPQVISISADPHLIATDSTPAPAVPFRIALSGTIYPDRIANTKILSDLAVVWPGIRRAFPEAELVYAGSSFALFPAALQPFVTNLGPLSSTAHASLLGTCSLACMNVAYAPSSIFKFSVPSRLADFLAAGLPVVASRSPGTALGDFLAPLAGDCVTLSDSPTELRAALLSFLTDPAQLTAQSRSARRFARAHFATAPLAQSLFTLLGPG